MDILTNVDWNGVAGVAAALLLVFDRLSKIIPSESFGKTVGLISKIFGVLGVKVPDVK